MEVPTRGRTPIMGLEAASLAAGCLPVLLAAAADANSELQPQRDEPARTLDRELARIASRYDAPTAALVALTMEYPWSEQQARQVQN